MSTSEGSLGPDCGRSSKRRRRIEEEVGLAKMWEEGVCRI